MLTEFVASQAEEYRRRHELYGEKAGILGDFSAGADDLNTAFDLHVRSVGMTIEIQAVLKYLKRNDRSDPLLLLDSGCGIGTYSIAFAALGYHVTGIDLNADFIDLARERVAFYKQRLSCSIECGFIARNILKEPADGRFDLVWAREAISHVHPLEDYLCRVRELLRPGGILAISDANWSNPLVKLQLFRSHGRHYRPFRTRGEASIYYVTQRRDPETGETVDMAMERILSLSQTLRKFRQAGFADVSGETIALIPKATLAKILSKDSAQRAKAFGALLRIEKTLLSLPCVRRLGQTNLVVGRKA